MFAILPIVVVLPLPLTPTKINIFFSLLFLFKSKCSLGVNIFCIFLDKISSISFTPPSFEIFSFLIESSNLFTTSRLMSDEIRTFSNSSNVTLSIFLFFSVSKILNERMLEVLLNFF